jgi:hypothetical protein
VAAALQVAPDLTPETLPLLDAFLRTTVATAAAEERNRLLEDVACYFGEVVRQRLGGHWALLGPGPREWRVELEACFLHFSPIGMAGEALLGCESSEFDGAFDTLEAVRPDLAERLEEAPPLAEREYYSLAGRIEVLEIVADWLIGRAQASDGEPVRYTREDYQRQRHSQKV